MTALAEPQRGRRRLLELLSVELAPREGRWAAVTRIATGCAITVAIAMVFQIPQPTYMAYIVFLISKDEKNATVTSALGGLIAVTLAVLLVLGMELIDSLNLQLEGKMTIRNEGGTSICIVFLRTADRHDPLAPPEFKNLPNLSAETVD